MLPPAVSTPRTSSSKQEGVAESPSSSKQEDSIQSRNMTWSDLSLLVTPPATDMDWAISPRSRSEYREDTDRDATKAAALLLWRGAPFSRMSTSSQESAATSRSSSKQAGTAQSRRSRASSLVSWSSPCWEETRTMLYVDSGDEDDSAREQTVPEREVAQWDILTLRQWFNMIDVDRSGGITRHEWFDFIAKHPKFRDLVLGVSGQRNKERFNLASWHHTRNQAVQMKKVMKIIQDLDTDNNG